jgi:sn-glycerol 3-phosphate transport system ATP-binding protein
MNGGRVEQIGTPTDLYRKPATRFVAGFLGSPAMNFLSGRVENDGIVAIGADRIQVSPGIRGALPGAAIEVGLRPEDLRLAEPGAAQLSMEVEFVEELGATRLVHGRSPGGLVTVQVPAAETRASGTLGLAIDPTLVHLFDPADGSRIGTAG